MAQFVADGDASDLWVGSLAGRRVFAMDGPIESRARRLDETSGGSAAALAIGAGVD